MRGPKTFAEWVEAYVERDSDTEYVLTPGERVIFDPMHGFFTYSFDAASNEILVPKMCGDGKYWRPLIYALVLASGARGVYCCTKRNPRTYQRILGGELVKMTHEYDFRTGKETTLWYIFITPKDTKEGDKHADSDSAVPVHAAGSAGVCEGGRRDNTG